ncbi:Holliday junction resolvase RuvX [Candidatus Peregrinibacteria bacterium CG_4_9_14_0_2_um_filter_41_14]|nr:MAG: Holliday junction resolvase RuvX [Candidatus Peregrinibacteria bacterium CG_4_10_14_0_2_um_filter_41_8]PJC37605.1 MAG: Holliday junction resolvase RuvX [Candidatus Peregrinibacteria bacterium CG_4_9_14_0_2_um_filter_41_14]
MQNKGRILAIDYGEKRVGLALSDADQIIAFPRQTLSNDESLFVRIKDLVATEEIVMIIVGLPLHADHTESYQTRLTRTFADELAKVVDVEVMMMDEKFTTFEARERIAGADPKQVNTDKDQLSAMILLEEYLANQVR